MIRKRKIPLRVLPSQERFLRSQTRKKGFSGRLARQTVRYVTSPHVSGAQPKLRRLDRGSHFSMLFDVTLRSMLEILEEKRFSSNYHKSDKILTLPQGIPRSCFAPWTATRTSAARI